MRLRGADPVGWRVAAVLVAAGEGRRLKRRVHKSFVRLASKPLLAWSLAALERAPEIREVIVVAHPADLTRVRRGLKRWKAAKVIRVVPGGNTRSESVYRGLQALPQEARWVVVHDAARPLVTPAVIRDAVRVARRHRAAIAAVPMVPTVKEVSGGRVVRTLERSRLWEVQTPQVFRRDLLERAHAAARAGRKREATDDASLVERMGVAVRVSAGSARNLKVTTAEDLVVAEALLRRGGRVGGSGKLPPTNPSRRRRAREGGLRGGNQRGAFPPRQGGPASGRRALLRRNGS